MGGMEGRVVPDGMHLQPSTAVDQDGGLGADAGSVMGMLPSSMQQEPHGIAPPSSCCSPCSPWGGGALPGAAAAQVGMSPRPAGALPTLSGAEVARAGAAPTAATAAPTAAAATAAAAGPRALGTPDASELLPHVTSDDCSFHSLLSFGSGALFPGDAGNDGGAATESTNGSQGEW